MKKQVVAPGAKLWSDFDAALRAAGLPKCDLEAVGQCFFSFEDGAAYGGFEQAGTEVLLRSIVVVQTHRRLGLGGSVLNELLAEARRRGAEAAWLLTTNAQNFFARHGFHAVERSAASPTIAASSQFMGVCPASAVLMRLKPL